MSKIKEIWMDDSSCDDSGMGIVLYVNLQNGEGIIISLDSKADEPLFRDVVNGKCRSKPLTDGERVYWENGASLSVQEMISILQTDRREGSGAESSQ